jgi:hypothetical protein
MNPSKPPMIAKETSIKNRLLVFVMGAILPQPTAPVMQTMTGVAAKYYKMFKVALIDANPGSGYYRLVGKADRRRKLRPFISHKEKL